MSRRVTKNIYNFFKNPLVEGRYPVIPPPEVPQHIDKPAYATSKNPIFGEYEKPPLPHAPEAISSKTNKIQS